MFAAAGTVLDAGWVGEAIRFIEQRAETSQAAVFRAAPRPRGAGLGARRDRRAGVRAGSSFRSPNRA